MNQVTSFFTENLLKIFLLGFGIFLLFYRTRFTRTAVLLNKLPGGSCLLPVFGNIGDLYFGDLEDVIYRIGAYIKKYGNCCKFWDFETPTVFVVDVAVVEKLLSTSEHIEKPSVYDGIKPYLGLGLVTSEVSKWKKDRKQLNGGMKHSLFPGFLRVFNKNAEILFNKLQEEIVDEKQENFRDLFVQLSQCTLNAVSDTALGETESFGSKDVDSLIITSLQVAGQGMMIRDLQPYYNFPILWDLFGNGKMEKKYIDPAKQLITEYILKKRAERNSAFKENKTEEKSPSSILDIVLDPENPRDTTDILDHVFTMLGAGTDTTASCLNYTLFLLALHPSHQYKVQMELDDIFKNRIDQSITTADLADMKYLEMCIKESMRLYPPIPMIARQTNSDIPIDNKLVIPKGCRATICIYAMHHNPEVFPEPEQFNPERFTTEASASRSSYSFIPFSAGIRNCIGHKYAMMEVKVILAHLLRKFTFTTSITQEKLKVAFLGIVLKPIGGIPLSMKHRKE